MDYWYNLWCHFNHQESIHWGFNRDISELKDLFDFYLNLPNNGDVEWEPCCSMICVLMLNALNACGISLVTCWSCRNIWNDNIHGAKQATDGATCPSFFILWCKMLINEYNMDNGMETDNHGFHAIIIRPWAHCVQWLSQYYSSHSSLV